ncbi:hypothetical protein GCM10011371_21810 [Novosphingobium marinum]|uniref:BLUF domain-containing protein n=1 Tax=Novosphingobium marinum TaxID=1514948 RepID=UPI0015CC93C6|nr:BLUF domain-containing protein [Novosphingobium marinum]GGC34067.1 hypothetical protein GCM10011371_21810 [Novosphingobium marinum]
MSSFEKLERWVYVSESLIATERFEEEIDKIVSVSRRRNFDMSATGALIFAGRRFAQLIEGPPECVVELRKSISADVRHRLVTTICSSTPNSRQFKGWALVYSGASRYMSDILNDVVLGDIEQNHTTSRVVLKIFEAFAAEAKITR